MRTKGRARCINHPDRQAEGRSLCKACYTAWRRQEDPVRNARERQRDRAAWYGITLADFNRLLHIQGYRCAICEASLKLKSRQAYHIDHCHKTDRVRGILCSGCNRGIGLLGDDEAGVMRALDYLRRFSGDLMREAG
jgi:hypothetical protein